MTPRPRVLSGPDVVRALGAFGFKVVATRGSHAKLRRVRPDGADTITVPLHRELAPGTARACEQIILDQPFGTEAQQAKAGLARTH